MPCVMLEIRWDKVYIIMNTVGMVLGFGMAGLGLRFVDLGSFGIRVCMWRLGYLTTVTACILKRRLDYRISMADVLLYFTQLVAASLQSRSSACDTNHNFDKLLGAACK